MPRHCKDKPLSIALPACLPACEVQEALPDAHQIAMLSESAYVCIIEGIPVKGQPDAFQIHVLSECVCLTVQLQGVLPKGSQTHFRSIITDDHLRVKGSNGSIYAIGDAATIEQVLFLCNMLKFGHICQ